MTVPCRITSNQSAAKHVLAVADE